MKLDATKIIGILVMLLQSAIVYIGVDILNRIDRVENRIEISVKAGAFDIVADYFSEQDSLSERDKELLEHILLESR